MTTFFVHLEDPGFPDHPWPGIRRLGPFLTSDEAAAQAISDAASGHGIALGVYSEAESEKRYGGGRDGKATLTRAQIAKRAETVARAARDETAARLRDDVSAIEATLPPGVGWVELKEAAETMRARVDRFTEETDGAR